MAIWSFSHSDRTPDIGHASDSVQCCYAVHWTDKNGQESMQDMQVSCTTIDLHVNEMVSF